MGERERGKEKTCASVDPVSSVEADPALEQGGLALSSHFFRTFQLQHFLPRGCSEVSPTSAQTMLTTHSKRQPSVSR